VFKWKTDENGDLYKYKARLCVCGFNQREGVDNNDVCSPTGRLTLLRLLLTLCQLNGFKVHQMDVKCVFLNGIPEEDLYIFPPQGLVKPSSNTILKLNKLLYGLKQSPRCWHKALTTTLEEIGLVKTKTDPCFYVSSNKACPFFLFAHVDDLIFGGFWLPELKQKISNCFEMEDLGKVRYTLGIQITQSADKISLVQDKHIKNILVEFNISNHCNTPALLPSNWNAEKDKPSNTPTTPPFGYH
jgi:hypothetical protein